MLKTNTDGKPLDPHGYLHFVVLKGRALTRAVNGVDCGELRT